MINCIFAHNHKIILFKKYLDKDLIVLDSAIFPPSLRSICCIIRQRY